MNVISKRVAHQQHLQICHTKYVLASLYASIMRGLATSPSIPSFPNPCKGLNINILYQLSIELGQTRFGMPKGVEICLTLNEPK